MPRYISRRQSRERAKVRISLVATLVVMAYFTKRGFWYKEVSTPEIAIEMGLGKWPGFDLVVSNGKGDRYVEIKGRAKGGNIRITKNEWRSAELHGKYYNLFVVYNCNKTPVIYYIRNPFNKLKLRKYRGKFVINEKIIKEYFTKV